MATILCTGSSRALNETRALILQQSGHEVVCAGTEAELGDACRGLRVAVAVIGQSLSNAEKQRIHLQIRNTLKGTLVLELYLPALGKALRDADDWMEVPNQYPERLAQRVNSLSARYLSTWREPPA